MHYNLLNGIGADSSKCLVMFPCQEGGVLPHCQFSETLISQVKCNSRKMQSELRNQYLLLTKLLLWELIGMNQHDKLGEIMCDQVL